MHFFIYTLGCKVNQYESHALREAWLSQGWQEANCPEEATCIVVNSCAVTANAVADTRNAVRRMHKASPNGRILVTGCSASVVAEELAALPGVAAVIPQAQKSDLLASEKMKMLTEDCAQLSCLDSNVDNASFDGIDTKDTPFPSFQVSSYDRSRAVLKIQDGCSHRCTYCIVPHTRGPARSRTMGESLRELERLIMAGFSEIIISGVNLRQYGRNFSEPHDFWDFLVQVETQFAPQWSGKLRLRLSSLEPAQLGEKALDVLGGSRLIAPHLHLSLQSGSESVLRRMGRGHYQLKGIHNFLRDLRRFWPQFALGADILTGFPGETDFEHKETMEFCDAMPLTYAHVFPYARRPFTAAASMLGQVPVEVKKLRAKNLRELVAHKQHDFLQECLQADVLQIVPELNTRNKEGASSVAQGICEFYAECVLTEPVFASLPSLIPVKPIAVEAGKLLALPLESV